MSDLDFKLLKLVVIVVFNLNASSADFFFWKLIN